MSETRRLNGIIGALERGEHAFLAFAKPEKEEAIVFGESNLDGVVFEMEHNAWDGLALRDALYYLVNRRRIVESGSIAPNVTPMVRIPANGIEMNQWLAKQALDIGVYGVVWPHVSTVEQAMNAVTSCRYPRPPENPLYHPAGQRGDGPNNPARYWGLKNPDYYSCADVWPLDPKGEVLVMLMIEDTLGIENLADILKEVPGIGCVLIGEGDLSQELGHPRQYDHPIVREAMDTIVARCKQANVPVGHPHATSANKQELIDTGYRILFTAPNRSFSNLATGRNLTKRT
jgi:4-hydroxy-2-oxoheptanedioate aldolase